MIPEKAGKNPAKKEENMSNGLYGESNKAEVGNCFFVT